MNLRIYDHLGDPICWKYLDTLPALDDDRAFTTTHLRPSPVTLRLFKPDAQPLKWFCSIDPGGDYSVLLGRLHQYTVNRSDDGEVFIEATWRLID
jgi:hypothetical protein